MAEFDLTAWDFKETFSGHEAAALILGLEPTEVSTKRVEPVASRLARDYYNAVHKLHEAYAGTEAWAGLRREDSDNPIPRDLIPEIEAESARQARADAEWGAAHAGPNEPETLNLLNSTNMMKWEREAYVAGGIELFDKFPTQPEPEVMFDDQQFERKEIVRWLQAIGMKSVYKFAVHQHASAPTPFDIGQPLATRERDTLLKLVIGMAIKGYSYSPTALKSPTPKEIADDLAILDISVSDDTIRKYLKQATQTVLPAKHRLA